MLSTFKYLVKNRHFYRFQSDFFYFLNENMHFLFLILKQNIFSGTLIYKNLILDE